MVFYKAFCIDFQRRAKKKGQGESKRDSGSEGRKEGARGRGEHEETERAKRAFLVRCRDKEETYTPSHVISQPSFSL